MADPLNLNEPPQLSFQTVETRIIKRLCEGDVPPAKTIAINATTGYGKTVLLSTLARHYADKELVVLWVSLEEGDESVERLLTRIESQIQAASEQLPPTQKVHQSDDLVQRRIQELFQRVRETDRNVLVCIDNLNCCHDETLGGLLDVLIFQGPENLYAVMASTQAIPISGGRAALAGRIERVGFQDMAMSADDIEMMIGESLPDAGRVDITSKISELTEGWPAAVRLLGIILKDCQDPMAELDAFSGSDIDLADMLNRQVLSGFDQRFQAFLKDLSLLNRFCVALCRHASGDDDASKHLNRLVESKLFVIPLDRNRNWYRLHALFRDFLASESEREGDDEHRRAVLKRAADWCEQRGSYADAIDYAFRADDPELAADILENSAEQFVRNTGDLSQYLRWVERLRELGVEPKWATEFWYVWGLVFHRRYHQAVRKIDPLQARIAQSAVSEGEEPKRREMQRRVTVLSIISRCYMDDFDTCLELAEPWVADIGGDDPFDVATVSCAISLCHVANFNLSAARDAQALAHATIGQAESEYGHGWVDALSCVPLLYRGEFKQAWERSTKSLDRLKRGGEDRGINSTVASVAACAAVELGKEAEAKELIDIALAGAHTHGVGDTCALALQAAVKLWEGPGKDEAGLYRLRDIAECYPLRISVMFSCFVAQRLLRLGHNEQAMIEAQRIGITLDGLKSGAVGVTSETPIQRFMVAQTCIELCIAQGFSKQATKMLEPELALAKKEERYGHLVELTLCEFKLALRSSNTLPATGMLTRAISQASGQRHIRPFAERADLIASLVNETKPKSWGFALSEEQSFFSDVCAILPLTAGSPFYNLGEGDAEDGLFDELTPRELELLSLIDAGLTNQQLADRLSLSVGTVKWHLYNLYNKLGVSNRSSAIAKGRSMNLL